MNRILPLGALAALLHSTPALAQAPAEPQAAEAEAPRPVPPQAFRSPEEGFAALVAALRASHQGQLQRVIGSANMRLVLDADAAARRAAFERFLAGYAAKSEILRPTPDRAVLQVGPDGFPLALPMVQRGGAWRFDSGAARQEILDRRIGRNELDTIQTLRAVADAQDEFARGAGRQGASSTYARRFFSTPGQRDGLFWPTAADEPPSPLGPFVAVASAGGYAQPRPGDRPQPYHGYIFRILESQGPDAPGGALDYVVNGRMIGGWAVIAAPFRYGSTGIMTFLVSHGGDVWQANLGPDTARLAAGITAFNPGQGWERVRD
ncbi:MAG: DUF2950 domain-containing protein [Roseococcus sp.]|nr:DUF2950 domain-containing protein [Roseococcus sp.]